MVASFSMPASMRPPWNACCGLWSGDDSDRGRWRICIASGHTDIRKGMNGLALLVQGGASAATRLRATSSCSAVAPVH
jgi:hypothetical protein